ncbi:MAG: cobalt ABC transporter ATP-binding protein [Elusimicrobia bacterium RIFOXYA2_FULL_58_8]|nr:MAG: cobalt ABC transporter ATP-binding protein [Elusimicrobia bacterium RIFOXYA2_FULL_58_8]OGS14163.1 MAG: cobalt ABC transporter ATP-binding protein [Elusimicrobia bacterium RIFOXYA12_FULL_57_11]
MNGYLIEAENLSYVYPDGTRGISKVSFKVAPGEAVALVGENGAGKSTLLQHLSGCLFATGGVVSVAGLPVIKENLPAVRRAAGMIFQNPDDQLFMPTVFDDVAFGLLNLGVGEGELEAMVLKALETVGIAHLRARPPYRLSQGEKRAAAIAAVVALEPEVLVMDEPTSNLDPRARRRLMRLLKTFDHAKIIATHDLDFALEICDRTIVIHEGTIAADGPTTEVFSKADLLERCNLETPPSMRGCPNCAR